MVGFPIQPWFELEFPDRDFAQWHWYRSIRAEDKGDGQKDERESQVEETADGRQRAVDAEEVGRRALEEGVVAEGAGDSEDDDNSVGVEWEKVGCEEWYTPTEADLGRQLCVVCVPCRRPPAPSVAAGGGGGHRDALVNATVTVVGSDSGAGVAAALAAAAAWRVEEGESKTGGAGRVKPPAEG